MPTRLCSVPNETTPTSASARARCCSTSWCRRSSVSASRPAKQSGNGTGLCRKLGEPAPGPHPDLVLPPSPASLAGRPAWWFHPHGVEAKRAEALRAVGKHAEKLWAWAELPLAEVAAKLELLRGVGPWTIGSVMASALADPDAVAVGDFHLKNVVAFNLAGEARGTDERMLELLAPYAGQRGRVVRLLLLDGHRPPSFGPRKRILPMARW